LRSGTEAGEPDQWNRNCYGEPNMSFLERTIRLKPLIFSGWIVSSAILIKRFYGCPGTAG
jgi:hypothetical protein